MKKIKFIICFLFFFIGLLIIGESRIFYLDNFYTPFINTTMYKQAESTDEGMKQDILAAAETNDIELFTFVQKPISAFEKETIIYGTDDMEAYFADSLDITEGTYSSLLLGDRTFKFEDFSNLPDFGQVGEQNDFYLLGDSVDAEQFKVQLIDKYAGNFPKSGYEDHSQRNTVIMIWMLMTCMVLLFTFYDMTQQRKEVLIKIIMGERLGVIIFRNILIDTVVFSAIFLSCLLVLSKISIVSSYYHLNIAFFILMLLLNATIYFGLRSYNLKADFSNSRSSRKILTLNYVLKVVTVVLTVALISSNVGLITESINIYRQKPFFKAHSAYEYVQVGYDVAQAGESPEQLAIKDAAVQLSFYQTFFQSFDATVQSECIVDFVPNHDLLYVNQNNSEVIFEEIPELANKSFSARQYLLIPEALSGDKSLVDNVELGQNVFNIDQSIDDHVIYYPNHIEMLGLKLNDQYQGSFYSDPIIIFDNTVPTAQTFQSLSEGAFPTYLGETMYKVSDVEMNQFMAENHLADENVRRTNVYESYQHRWENAKTVLYINLVFSLMMVFLELLIIGSIIKLEYEVNAVDMAIKKTLGYSLYERNKKIVLLTILTTVISIIFTEVVAILVLPDVALSLLIAGTCLLMLEMIVIFFQIRKTEADKLTKILKGGNV